MVIDPILIVFAGREYCMELQIPYIIKILEKYPTSEYHIWNFARNEFDNEYLNSLPNIHERIKIFNDHYEGPNEVTKCIKKPNTLCNCSKCRVGKWIEPYKYYSNPSFKEKIFIKLDDDIVYIDLNGFNDYLLSIYNNPNHVISANVINNGTCALYDPIINKYVSQYIHTINEWPSLCTNLEFLSISHDLFFSNQYTKEDKLIPNKQKKLSINTIGFNYNMIYKMSNIFHKSPNASSDEKIFNSHSQMFIYQNFITSHLHFSDQNALMSDELKSKYIKKYKELCDTII
jgi:hypothetical protein